MQIAANLINIALFEDLQDFLALTRRRVPRQKRPNSDSSRAGRMNLSGEMPPDTCESIRFVSCFLTFSQITQRQPSTSAICHTRFFSSFSRYLSPVALIQAVWNPHLAPLSLAHRNHTTSTSKLILKNFHVTFAPTRKFSPLSNSQFYGLFTTSTTHVRCWRKKFFRTHRR